MDTVAEKTIAQLYQRIEHLEENRRFFHNSLEMVLNLADFRNNLGENNNETFFLAEAIDRIRKIVPLECCSIYLVDDRTAEFNPAYCSPCECNSDFNDQVEHMIDDGMFAWAVRERKGVFTLNHSQRQTLLHVIGNYSGVKGMFIGVLEEDQQEITQSSLILVTFILFSLANILENIFLYQEVKKQNTLLEEKVAERTKSLNRSTQELKITMQRLKKFARLAEQSNRAKSQFLANMSHEIRTPLNGIIGCTELMLKSQSLADCHHLAGVSLNEAEHLLHLINNVLDYSKIEAGHIKLEKHPLHLGQLVKMVTDGLAPQASAKGVALRYELDEKLQMAVRGDALRLRQILINLANNAIKFTSEGSVTLRVTRNSFNNDGRRQSLNFAVIDTGIGIPPERQAAIFKRFTQVDESITRRYGGTGLGTTIAHQLVTLMGGRLVLESEVGRGSNFSFTIDMDSAPAEAVEPFLDFGAATAPSPSIHQHPAKILVAEDAPVNQMVLRSHLETLGHRVTIAENGRLAINACRKEKFDLILMDVQMPETDGITATRTILAEADKDAAPIVIALTADVQAKTRSACEAAGAVAVLNKPIRRGALAEIVSKWLNVKHGLNESASSPEPHVAAKDDLETHIRTTVPWDVETACYEFGDAATAHEVVHTLIENIGGYIQDMQSALTVGDLEQIRSRAHAIKGGAATAEAGPMSEAAAVLETHCKEKQDDEIPGALKHLIIVFDELKGYVGTMTEGSMQAHDAKVSLPS